jgi:hypothetical protein
MTAYNNIDPAVAGLPDGINNKYESWKAREELSFGKAVFGHKGDALNASVFYRDVAKMVWDGDFVTDNSIVVTVDGEAAAAVPFNATQVDTLNDVIAAVAALDDVECVADSTDTSNRTILIRKKYVEITASAVVTGGASQADETVTYDSSMVYLGITSLTQKEDGKYNEGDCINVCYNGRIKVLVKANVSANNPAYVDEAGADKGEFSDAGLDTGSKYRDNALTDGIAIVEITDVKYSGEFAEIDFS